MRNMTRVQVQLLVAASFICVAPAILARPECPCDPDTWRAEVEEEFGDMIGCQYSSVMGTKEASGFFEEGDEVNFAIAAKSHKRCGTRSSQFTSLRGGQLKACVDDWLVYCASEF